ncbi:MAG: hypothetical protein HKN36_13255 [Hellea sp.]|nr:hypothetical protein [Hellea sp.]
MTKQYLNVDYKDKDLVKRLGGRWDPTVRKWYCPRGSELSKILAWRPAKVQLVERAETHLAAMLKAQNEPIKVPKRREPAQLSLLG